MYRGSFKAVMEKGILQFEIAAWCWAGESVGSSINVRFDDSHQLST
jgi:hypothetical protein